jgi:hypothetical protein
MITSYMKTLDLDTCKADIIRDGLLSTNTKLKKGEYSNHGLELLPSVLSPINTCESAGECKYHCLAFSGVGNVLKGKKMFAGVELSNPLKSKARKTFVFINDRSWFEAFLKVEIQQKADLAKFSNIDSYFRLNVTSDLDWAHITNAMPNINFYDYTKVWNRKSTKNYSLTFSASEKTNLFSIAEKLMSGENVAVAFVDAFKGKAGQRKLLINNFLGFNVINGDTNDNRSLDEKGGQIIALDAKVPAGGLDKKNKFFFSINEDTQYIKDVA